MEFELRGSPRRERRSGGVGAAGGHHWIAEGVDRGVGIPVGPERKEHRRVVKEKVNRHGTRRRGIAFTVRYRQLSHSQRPTGNCSGRGAEGTVVPGSSYPPVPGSSQKKDGSGHGSFRADMCADAVEDDESRGRVRLRALHE